MAMSYTYEGKIPTHLNLAYYEFETPGDALGFVADAPLYVTDAEGCKGGLYYECYPFTVNVSFGSYIVAGEHESKRTKLLSCYYNERMEKSYLRGVSSPYHKLQIKDCMRLRDIGLMMAFDQCAMRIAGDHPYSIHSHNFDEPRALRGNSFRGAVQFLNTDELPPGAEKTVAAGKRIVAKLFSFDAGDKDFVGRRLTPPIMAYQHDEKVALVTVFPQYGTA